MRMLIVILLTLLTTVLPKLSLADDKFDFNRFSDQIISSLQKPSDPCKEATPVDPYFQCRLAHLIPDVRADITGPGTRNLVIYYLLWLTDYLKLHPPPRILNEEIGVFYQPKDLSLVRLNEKQTHIILKHKNRPILYFVFQDGLSQDLAFLRMATYIESQPEKIMNNNNLFTYLNAVNMLGLSGDGGYDFRASDILRFYQQAKIQKIQLNPMEKLLLEELKNFGLDKDQFAVLSVTQSASQSDREHEFNHGLYFTDTKYRNAVQHLVQNLAPDVRIKAIALLKKITAFYNFTNDWDLTAREYAAWYRDPDLMIKYVGDSDYDFISQRANELRQLNSLIPEYSSQK